MGLDISAYSNMTLLKEFNDNYDWEMYDAEYPDENDAVHVYVNPHFLHQAGDLVNGMYRVEGRIGFRAGSYSGYNSWRNHLAIMAGYASAESVWAMCNDDYPENKPFVEIIHFSDCEGTISAKMCAKLLRDFDDFDSKAREYGETRNAYHFYDLYVEWKEAFRLASISGAVCFH